MALGRLAHKLWLWWHGPYIEVTPRELMAAGLWEKARDVCATACGQWVYDSGLRSLDKPIIMTIGEAHAIGYRPAHLEPAETSQQGDESDG